MYVLEKMMDYFFLKKGLKVIFNTQSNYVDYITSGSYI